MQSVANHLINTEGNLIIKVPESRLPQYTHILTGAVEVSGVPTSFVQSCNALPTLVADKLLTEQHVMLLYHSNWSNCLHYTPVTTLNVPLRSPSLLLYAAHPNYLSSTLFLSDRRYSSLQTCRPDREGGLCELLEM
jgi:hypothetical protein